MSKRLDEIREWFTKYNQVLPDVFEDMVGVVEAAERLCVPRGIEFDCELPYEHREAFMSWRADLEGVYAAVRAFRGEETPE